MSHGAAKEEVMKWQTVIDRLYSIVQIEEGQTARSRLLLASWISDKDFFVDLKTGIALLGAILGALFCRMHSLLGDTTENPCYKGQGRNGLDLS